MIEGKSKIIRQRRTVFSSFCAIIIFIFGLSSHCLGEDIAYPVPDNALANDPILNIPDSLFPSSTTNNNTVVVNSGTIGGVVLGGYQNGGGADDSTGNTVIINDCTSISQIIGGAVTGGTGNASGNIVTVYRGSVEVVRGGKADHTGTGSANNNVVNIYGGNFDSIYGGEAGKGTARDNTVNLYSGSIRGALLGGNAGGKNIKDGNTLNLYGWTGSVDALGGFEHYKFYLPGTAANGDTIIRVNAEWEITDIENCTIDSISFMGGGSVLNVGDTITLIDSSSGLGMTSTGLNLPGPEEVQHGAWVSYTLDAYVDGYTVVTEVLARTVDSDINSLPMGRVSTLAALRQGGDLVADTGLQNLVAAFDWQDVLASRSSPEAYASLAQAGWSGPTFFSAIGGGHYSLKAGKRIGIDGVSALAGLGWRNRAACGSLLLGAFFETGYSDYDGSGYYGNAARVKADGDSRYYGGGLVARYDWQSGLYTEASIRLGEVKNKFDGSPAAGASVHYKTNSVYYGAHAGLGFKFRPTANSLLDLSAKYLWTRQDSDTATASSLGDRVHFDADNSHRLRAGARYSYNVNSCFSPYVGAAFEYEFDSKSRASLGNYALTAPSVKGGTGIGEVGFTYRKNAFTADLGVQGHVGKREAVTGTLRVGWSF